MNPDTPFFQPSKVAAVLIAGFVSSLFWLSSVKSTTFDESLHLAAGLSYVSTGSIILNTQHPPLLKILPGLSLLAGGVQWPDTPETRVLATAHEPTLEVNLGKKIIGDNGGEHVMFWGRLPMILLAGLYAAGIYLWASALLSPAAGLGALALFILDPLVLGHAYLVTTDTGFAGFTVLFLFTFWRFLQRGSRKLLVLSGLMLGLAMCCKFSGVALVPIAILLYVASLRWPARDWAETGTPVVSAGVKAMASILLIAFAAIYLLYLFPRDPLAYLDGYHHVNADHISNYRFYLAGKFGPNRSDYLAVAYMVKQPIASLILAAVGLFAMLRSSKVSDLAKLFLMLPPVILFAGYAAKAANIGVRYMIPVSVFLLILGGFGLASLLQARRSWQKGAGALLCVWLLVAAVGVSPDHLSYFNEFACASNTDKIGWDGGSSCGIEWLDDSNIDWGQGLVQLRAWLRENAPARPVYLSYFGSISPSAYGLDVAEIEYSVLNRTLKPGLYVVSANHVLRARPFSGGEWLRAEPSAVIGHAFYVYDIP